MTIENIFICACGEVLVDEVTGAICSRCEQPMEKTGHTETSDIYGPVDEESNA